MTTGDLSRQIYLSTPNPQQNQQELSTHKHPRNINRKNTDKMEAVYEEPEDETMEDGSLDSSGMTPMQHSARLAAKLEKLWQTDQTIDLRQNQMEIDTEEQKKRARAITPGANKLDIAKPDQKTNAPEIKKLRNDETPPRQLARKAKAHEAGTTHMDTETAEEKTPTTRTQESLQEQEKPPEDEGTSKTKGKPEESEAERHSGNKTLITKDNHHVPPTEGNQKAQATEEQGLDSDQTQAKEQVEANTTTQAETDERQQQNVEAEQQRPATAPTEVSPKEWQKHHNLWLNAVMRAAIGEDNHPPIPNPQDYVQVHRPTPDNDINVAPVRDYVTPYDLRIKVAAGENQVELFHQAFCKWYLKLREVDPRALLYPWAERVRDEEGILIEKPTDIPTALPLFKKFVHKLFLRTTGGAYHVQVLLGTNTDLETIMETIGWWLKSTEQGMWRMDLQDAEDTICAGWLLFSADEYDREALSHEIWNLTGVRVALRFRAIDDGNHKDGKTKTTLIKALHVEIDRVHQTITRSRIKFLYSSRATAFPLGFKMRLVRDHRLLTNTQAKAKAASLRAHQARFLAQMETCSTWEVATVELIDRQTQANLRQIIMNIPDPVQPACKLFHAVNKMYIRDGYIFRFHPSRSQQAREVVAGLLVFLKGLWSDTIDTHKFNKFFMEGAIERSRDAWWDSTTLSVITKADQEMANILTFDTDLIFPETRIEMDMSGATTPAETIAKLQDNLLSTGSISTFRTTASKNSRATRKSPQKVKTTTASSSTNDTDSVLSSATLSEQELSFLLARLTQAMSVQQQQINQTNQKEQTGGRNAGSNK